MTKQAQSAADKVIVAIFDGLRADMATPERSPNVCRLMRRGAWFQNARSVFPSVTRVATTSVATGATPGLHGVVGNAFYLPEVFRDRVIDTSNIDHVRVAEALLPGGLVAVPTLGDALSRAGKRFAVVHTGSAGSAHLVNPRARHNGHWTFSIHGADASPTPEAAHEVVARLGEAPQRALPRIDELDYAARVMTEHVLPVLRPDVALVWFNEPDTTFHYREIGSRDSQDALSAADAAFGRILDWIEAQPDADRFAVIAGSDHGQISTSGAIPLADEARKAGFFLEEKDGLSGASFAMTGGRSGEIRSLDGADAGKVARWLMEHPAVGHVFSRGRNEVEGVIPGTLAFETVSADHARQPDLAFVLRAQDSFDSRGLSGLGLMTVCDVPLGGGMHGGLHEKELNTLLVVAAPGRGAAPTVSNKPAGIIDIAPTVLGLLGLTSPATMQGRNLLAVPEQEPVLRRFSAGERGFEQTVDVVEHGGRRFILGG